MQGMQGCSACYVVVRAAANAHLTDVSFTVVDVVGLCGMRYSRSRDGGRMRSREPSRSIETTPHMLVSHPKTAICDRPHRLGLAQRGPGQLPDVPPPHRETRRRRKAVEERQRLASTRA